MTAPRQTLVDHFHRHVCQTSAAPLGIVVERASGARVWDVDGREYLDLLSGIGVAGVGHCNPDVVAAIAAQAPRYLHTLVYGEAVERPQVELARMLAELAPGELSVSFFANSGTEAIEGAIKLARKVTGRKKLIAFRGAYHGDTTGALALCDSAVYRAPFEPLLGDVVFLPFGETSHVPSIGNDVAAVIVEPIQSEGGVRIPPADFLPVLRERCDQTGALLVCDEVMTGLGRTGRWFASEHWDIRPDVIALAKALGGGLPLGAFIGRPEHMRALSEDPPLCHVTTFGGHPLSCAAGLAALRFTERQRLPERAESLGAMWLRRLREVAGGALAQVRGKGLLLGLQFASAELTERFSRKAFERGLILNWTLHHDSVVRLAPPLILSDGESDEAIDRVIGVLRSLE